MKDVRIEEVERIAQELVPIPGCDPHIQQRILPVLHSIVQVQGQGPGKHQAKQSE